MVSLVSNLSVPLDYRSVVPFESFDQHLDQICIIVSEKCGCLFGSDFEVITDCNQEEFQTVSCFAYTRIHLCKINCFCV